MALEQTVPRHVLLPPHISVSLSSQERAFLEYKGCLTLPRNEICLDLFRAYFHHVHSLIPVIDAEEILRFQGSNHVNECNMLLLWAIFFVAVNVSKLTLFPLPIDISHCPVLN